MLTKEERHFIEMCGYAGMIFGCKFSSDKDKAEKCIRSKYSDPVYQVGYQKIVEDRFWLAAFFGHIKSTIETWL